MTKDFDEFESEVSDGKFLDESKELFYELTKEFDDKNTYDSEEIFAFSQQYAERLTMLRLRQYHEWLNS